MATARIEQTRLLHQDLEQHMHKMVEDLLEEVKTQKDRIFQEQRVALRLQKLKETSATLVNMYEDPDGLRKKELQEISGEHVFGVFYDKLKSLREFHRKWKGDPIVYTNDVDLPKPKVRFSGPECYGKFLDLHELFDKYKGLSMLGQHRVGVDFLKFLDRFYKFDYINKDVKINQAHYKQYRDYVNSVLEYLRDFHDRTHPLIQHDQLDVLITEEFEKQWKTGMVPGWEDLQPSKPAGKKEKAEKGEDEDDEDEDEEGKKKKEKEEENGDNNGDGNGAVNKDDPLYCAACSKGFTKQSTFDNHLKGRKHKKAMELFQEGKGDVKKQTMGKDLAHLEFTIFHYADLLKDQIEATKEHVEKKQTRTWDEIAADLEEAVEEQVELSSSSEDEDEEKPIHNPLNLPLGWDGKPIPFWLYKLHGLNIEYKCEICGNFSYWGPRAYERHFTEWRHNYGLRCLGIENTRHFKHITRFEDAIGLNEKIQREKMGGGWKAEEDEELEDDEGNVFNKKIYEDLKRQGII